MTVKKFDINVQPLYDVVALGKDVHRPTLDDKTFAFMRARHYTTLENISLKYEDEHGDEIKVSATDNGNPTVVRIKIFALYVQSDRYDYSRSDRDRLKRKLGLSELNCSNYMPEIIDGTTREWTVDNLEDAINAFRK